MTHAELVTRAERWLKNTLHCRVVLTELRAYTITGEIPDAIGWVNGRSVMVECKTSRADFIADQKKVHRQRERLGLNGIGQWRFYLTSEGLLNGLELPPGWGLYEVCNGCVCYKSGQKYSNALVPPFIASSCKDSEIAMLVSALARQ